MMKNGLTFRNRKANTTAHKQPNTSDESAVLRHVQDRISSAGSNDVKISNSKFSLVLRKENPPKSSLTNECNRLKRCAFPTIPNEMAWNDNATFTKNPSCDREPAMELEKENIAFERDLDKMIASLDTALNDDITSTTISQRRNGFLRAEKCISFLNLNTCALAAIDTFALNRYFPNVKMNAPLTPTGESISTSERDISSNESLMRQLTSFGSSENTQKNVQDSEYGRGVYKRMIPSCFNDSTLTVDDELIRISNNVSNDKSITSSNGDQLNNYESENNDASPHTEKANKVKLINNKRDRRSVTWSFLSGIANICKHRKSYNERDNLPSVDGAAGKNKQKIRRISKRLGNNFFKKKLKLSRTSSTSSANSFGFNNSSVSSLGDDDDSMLYFDSSRNENDSDSLTSYLSSRFSDLNSHASMGSEMYKSSLAKGSGYLCFNLHTDNVKSDMLDRTRNIGVSIPNRLSPTPENLGLEVKAHPEMLFKYV